MAIAMNLKGARRITTLLLGALGVVGAGALAEDLLIPLELPQPNFVGVGIGSYPDYLGSDNQAQGVAPILRLSLGGNRFARLFANELRINLLDHPNWQLGPVGLWRFGRDDVDNPVVDRMDDIDDALSLGLFTSYVWRDPLDIRRTAGAGGWVQADVSGVHDGWTAGLNAYASQPVAKMVTLAGGAAFTYASDNYMDAYFGVTRSDSLASGLPRYAPGSGVRDVRGWAAALLHLGPQWHLGAGVMYSRLVGDAADSPLVSEEGSKDQWVYGVGGLYAW